MTTSPFRSRVLVAGGTGMIGREICRALVEHGFTVTSLSRNPPSSLSQPGVAHWHADVVDVAAYKEVLAGCDAVVCAVGSLLPSQAYKAFMGKGTAVNPREGLGSLGAMDLSEGAYEKVNRLPAAMLAKAFAELGGDGEARRRWFVLLSAGAVLPVVVPPGYLTSKRAAEEDVAASAEKGRFGAIILRPGVVYSHANPASMGVAAAAGMAHTAITFPSILAGRAAGGKERCLDRPIDAQVLADGLAAILRKNIEGGVAAEDGARTRVITAAEMERWK